MITVGDAKTAITVLQNFPTTDFAVALAANFGNVADDVALGEDLLPLIAIVFPEAAGIITLIEVLTAIVPLLPAFHITPDPFPERDAQTSTDAEAHGR